MTPTQNVSRGSGPVNYLERESINLDTLSFLDSGDKKITVADMLEKTFTDGFIVLRNGKILSEQYFTGMQPSSYHLIQSGSKSIAISVLANLLSQRSILPESKVRDYIPELVNCI